MKTIMLTLAALALASGSALAAPGKSNLHRGGHGVSAYERVAIARSAAHLAMLKRQARADGKVTMMERARIRSAEFRHTRLVARARHS
jgi:hypothetical protein